MNVYFDKTLVKASEKTIFELSETFNFCVASAKRGEGEPEVVELKDFSAERLVVEFGYSLLGLYSKRAEAQEACENFKEDYRIWIVATNEAAGYTTYYSVYSYEEYYCSDSFCSVQIFLSELEAYEEYQAILDSRHCWLLVCDLVSGEAWIQEFFDGTVEHAIGPHANLCGKYKTEKAAKKALNKWLATC